MTPRPRTRRPAVSRRGALAVSACGALAVAVLAVPSSAEPLPTGVVNAIVGPQGSTAGYLTRTVVSTTGSVVTFVNLDQTTHDITSRATKTVVVKKKKKQVPLFRSEIVAGGATGTIAATATLAAGSYDFFCSLHPGMTGTLMVQ